ncbi:phosphodiester glycosidase family protein [Streptococcaceae bacterium ESL0687]|nr:phosphodiester glycosidase family protein [Streptococcaceae bacterium ESL0687]
MKTTRKKSSLLKKISVTLAGLLTLAVLGVYTFFKTDVFADTRDLWVQTAMSTSSHKWLATSFLSDDEINKILAKYQVTNDTKSDSSTINLSTSSTSSTSDSSNTSIKEISGSTYKGYVVTIKDPSTVKLVNTLTSTGGGTKLSETVKDEGYQIALNAAGFNFDRKTESTGENALDSLTIMDGKLLYGDEDESYQMIGMTSEGKLVLGNYTYSEAIKAGITDAISFGPYLLVNGEDQVTEKSTGGLQPRTAIGQASDGTIFFVVIEGRSSSSAGATLYDLQEVMKDLGAVNATNLDGGGSSEMYYDGKLVNQLSNGSEREIPNAFVVTK